VTDNRAVERRGRSRASWALPALVVVTTCTAGVLLVHTHRSEVELQRLLRQRVEQSVLEGRVTWLDEVLTMSALMDARTLDVAWQRRYDQHVAHLDAAIRDLIAMTGDAATPELARSVDEANVALVAVETAAFEATRAGDGERAWALLNSPEYRSWKARYAAGIAEYEARAVAATQRHIAQNTERLADARLALTLTGLALVLAWAAMVQSLRRAHRASRAAAEALRARNDELESLNCALNDVVAERTQALERVAAERRAREDMMASVVHELRTPLSSIVGAADLTRDAQPEDLPGLLETIAAGGRSLAELVNDVLDLAKLERGELRLEAVDLSLPQLMADARAVLQPLAMQKSLHLTATVDPRISANLIGDPLRIRQVLINLGANALKFTERGQVSLSVVRHDVSPTHERLRFCVRDTGVGIAPERQTAVFAPYAQAEDSTARVYGGTGLGLTIVQTLVRAMGGEVTLESELGVGTVFRFDLDLALGDVSASVVGPLEVPTAGHVLVAEDNAVNLAILGGLLRRMGWTYDVAVDGHEAVEKARAGHYDAILLDGQMPRVDGLQAARLIRAAQGSGPKTPLFAVTGSSSPEELRAQAEAGFDAHLTKPITRRALADALGRLVLRARPSPSARGSMLRTTGL
jgi:signal transduction histidine kinase